MRRYNSLVLLLIFFYLGIQNASAQSFADNSVLSQGHWFKIGIVKSGLYKLDQNFLKKAGFLKSAVNPSNIRIYGNGGNMLPQANITPRIDDLVENSIYIEGESDGKFDKLDYVLFYGQGPDVPLYHKLTQEISVAHNAYSDTAYYFISVAEQDGKRIEKLANVEEGGLEVNTFNDFYHYEKDLVNVLASNKIGSPEKGSGREWYGEGFDAPILERNFTIDLSGYISNSPIKIQSSVLNCSYSNATFNIKLNNEDIGTHQLGYAIEGTYNLKGIQSEKKFSIQAASFVNPEKSIISYVYDKNGATEAIGFLNFFTINFERKLQLYGDQTSFSAFRSLESFSSKYRVANMSSQNFIWDITDIHNPSSLQFNINENIAEFVIQSDSLKQFVAFNAALLPSPISIQEIAGQNLHSLSPSNMLVITHASLLSEANRFAKFRAQQSNISVHVATVQQIFNEFSSGKQDVTALRDFIRMIYIKGGKQLKYVLLFGDCSYDYKSLKITNSDGEGAIVNTNLVPVYESRESLHPIKSYSSDDYFGFMEDNEGEWTEDSKGDHTLDISIGRIPCKNFYEAKIAVDKIIYYSSDPKSLGKWRNNISFVADNGDDNTHLKDTDRLAIKIDTSFKYLNTEKIYTAAYPLDFADDGSTSTALSKKTKMAIEEAVEKGSLIVNYTGHGGVTGWADEKILESTQIKAWTNYEKLPLFVTATCGFGKYDDPGFTSAGEHALLNPRGGAIALVTTTRPVFSSSNYILNKAFYESIFTKIDDRMPTLGEAMLYTKNNSLGGTVNRNFTLLGDPSLTLSYPKYTIDITELNGNFPDTAPDTLKALSNIILKGLIKDKEEVVNDFNGIVQFQVLDKPVAISTISFQKDPVIQFTKRESVIFRGKATVKNGEFAASFQVPKNINYSFGEARINLYALDPLKVMDAHGTIPELIIGGSSSEFALDSSPPSIQLYLNDSTFKSGDKVSTNNLLIAKLADESGINITSTSAGQDLKVILASGESSDMLLLNDYYEANLDQPNSGKLNYTLKNLNPGKYTLTLKAWDIYNNSSDASIAFEVVENKRITIEELYNFPNPFTSATGTTIQFAHDRDQEDLEAIIEIFTVEGKPVKTLKEIIYKNQGQITQQKWDGNDDSGNKINTGVYIYKLQLRSLSDKIKSYRSSKLLFIN